MAQSGARVIWDHEAASSNLATRTRGLLSIQQPFIILTSVIFGGTEEDRYENEKKTESGEADGQM